MRLCLPRLTHLTSYVYRFICHDHDKIIFRMPANVEIKARVQDIEKLKEKATKLSKSEGQLIVQEDTFFKSNNGRLKLRQLKGAPAQLIFYDRPDQAGPKFSEYHVATIDNPADLKVTLDLALGIHGEVKKRRMLYMVGQTRVHVDQVEGLGDFMELEVAMQPGQTVEEGQTIADDIMKKLDINEKDLITVAYMDLILNGK